MSLYYIPLSLWLTFVLTSYLRRKLLNLPPRPFPKLPLIGHLHLLRKPYHLSFYRLSNRYGPVFSFQFGSRRAVIVSSQSAVEECFTKENDIIFANRPRLLVGKHLGYNYTSLAWAPYGDHWRNLRRISATELLSPQRLNVLSAIRIDEIRRLIRCLFEDTTSRPVDLRTTFFDVAYNSMMRMIAGKRYFGNSSQVNNTDEATRFSKIVSETTRVGLKSAVGDFLPLLVSVGGIEVEQSLRQLHEKRDGFMQDLLDEHRHLQFKDSSCSTMVEILMSLQQTDAEYYNDEMIKALIIVLFQAGTDTSAATMEWAMANLLNNPQILNKVQTEIKYKVGQERLINESDLSELPYLECIINETMRKHPVFPLTLPRESSKDCTVAGFKIQQGTMLIVNLWAIQNDPNVWVDPERFNPDRFLTGDGVGIAKKGFNFMPFGSGRRRCPGERLAYLMVGLTLGSLLQCFDWDLIDDALVDLSSGNGATNSMAKPLFAMCWPRPEFANIVSRII